MLMLAPLVTLAFLLVLFVSVCLACEMLTASATRIAAVLRGEERRVQRIAFTIRTKRTGTMRRPALQARPQLRAAA